MLATGPVATHGLGDEERVIAACDPAGCALRHSRAHLLTTGANGVPLRDDALIPGNDGVGHGAATERGRCLGPSSAALGLGLGFGTTAAAAAAATCELRRRRRCCCGSRRRPRVHALLGWTPSAHVQGEFYQALALALRPWQRSVRYPRHPWPSSSSSAAAAAAAAEAAVAAVSFGGGRPRSVPPAAAAAAGG